MTEKAEALRIVDAGELPKHFQAEEAERRWDAEWEASGIYRYDAGVPRCGTFAVDTPPPTVSGSLHMGHVFSYTQTDFVVRFQRMLGRNIFYPMGWDDNGLPTERRVQNYYHVQCDPALPYEPDLAIEPATAKRRKERPRPLSRRNFVELCLRLTREDERAFMNLWRRAGLSVDWEQEYATIGPRAQRLAQSSFLDLYRKGHVYAAVSPTMWDPDFRTAIAQAELEDREIEGSFYRVEFGMESGDETFVIATTRPELLAACVGITAHPEDTRYRHLFGRSARTPVFHVPVPVFPSDKVDPEKGTGILMVCTFGDATDVSWWREQNLALRQIVGRDGRLLPVDFHGVSRSSDAANRAYRRLEGKRIAAARREMAQMLAEQGALVADPEAIRHPVKHYEKGKSPVEFLSTRQWFVRLLDKKQTIMNAGDRIAWHPSHMGARFRNWTENLQFDWCISRQRYFGVPFPVWYPVREDGMPDYEHPVLAPAERLPVDPMVDVPDGFTEEERNVPGGFTAEADVFDTWFTSSLTPQIASGWTGKPKRHEAVFPMDVRPQAHDIIRTWAFYTIVKALLHEDTVPWRNVLVSGWILDPDRKKMSKSRGNVVTPVEYLDRYSSDAVRYWAAGARLGVDTAFDETVYKVGRRLSTKIYNAAKFVLSIPASRAPVTHELDRAFLWSLRDVVAEATEAFLSFEYQRALEIAESFFWSAFTDAYIELVKARARGDDESTAFERFSAVNALRIGLSVLLRLFAPFLPFITEEVWSWVFALETGHSSIHTATWPTASELESIPKPAHPRSFEAATKALRAIHKLKTLSKVSVSARMERLEIVGDGELIAALRRVLADLKNAARVDTVQVSSEDTTDAGALEVRAAQLAQRQS